MSLKGNMLRTVVGMLLGAALLVGSPTSQGKPTKPAANDYSISIAGYVSGTGTATFDGATLSIKANITDENGNKGTFTATGLKLDAKNHFTGSGTAMGDPIKLGGRLDPVASKETTLKTDRVVCTFNRTNKDGHGRIAGYVPVDPALALPNKKPDNDD